MALLMLLQIPFAEDSFAVSASKHSAAAGAGAYRLLTGGTAGETESARSDVAVSVPFSKKKPKVTVRKGSGRSFAFRTGVNDTAANICRLKNEICVFLTSIRTSGISAVICSFTASYRGRAEGSVVMVMNALAFNVP